jgi:hypothetical protein
MDAAVGNFCIHIHWKYNKIQYGWFSVQNTNSVYLLKIFY